MDARKQAITIGNLLSMTSGLREDDGGMESCRVPVSNMYWICRWTWIRVRCRT